MMTEKLVSHELIDNALEDIGAYYDAKIHAEYSGRGMSGRTCLGVSFGSVAELPAFGAALATQAAYKWELDNLGKDSDVIQATMDVRIMFDNARVDNLGHGLIVYFPGYKLTD